MEYLGFVSMPGGTEWLCLLAFPALVAGVILLVILLVLRGKRMPPVYAPRICNSCGKGNIADARFCSYCGRELNQPPRGESE